MESQEFLAALEYELQSIRAQLHEAAGGRSTCSIHKFDTPSAALKYNEGKEYILRQVVNRLKKGAALEDAVAVLEEQEMRFERIVLSPVASTRDWQAYAAGGIDGGDLIRSILQGKGRG